MRCQTSPDYSLMRYGSPGKGITFDNAGGGGFLYSLSSALLPWESDQQSCNAVSMGAPTNASDIPYGSFALLWPVFLRLCLSHFVETLSCALQGRAVVTEAGMSIFEHSLAFAEAESVISQSIGLGIFGLPKQGRDESSLSAAAAAAAAAASEGGRPSLHVLTRAQVLERMNVTPELLLISLISCCNSLMSNLLDVIGRQSRYRLFHTAFWGLCFMAAMVFGLLGGTPLAHDTGVVRFPTVCIVGFVPHLLILFGILSCVVIYALALIITAFSLPFDTPRPVSLRERLQLAHENMQGANQIRSIRFNRHEDFYTTLLKVGYTALTAASEAVFLNEGGGIVARKMTWLEEDRLAEIEASRGRSSAQQSWNSYDTAFRGMENVSFDLPERSLEWESGYGREKKIERPKNGSRSVRSPADPGGVGAFRGATRAYHVLSFFRAIFYLLLQWTAYGVNLLLDRLGIHARPQWLKTTGSQKKGSRTRNDSTAQPLDFWILTDDGELELPEDNEFDVENEMRKRERINAANWEQTDERRLDEKLYDWWKAGGSWGNQDQSPDYNPPESDDIDDTTSVVSMSTNASESEWEDESDGRRTPTQADPFPGSFSREGTPQPDALMDIRSLARLLDPRDRASREEARILAAHLAADRGGRILTRRQFQRELERERAQILLSARLPQLAAAQSGNDRRKPTPEEESEMLENLILSRRAEASVPSPASDSQSWETGASGLGPDGPPCVVCQTSPRSIIAWPCRCLCVCEECRVSLAMNNFGSCVTCRQEVAGFMRLWVP